jgi:hypothetical protein
MTAAEAAIREDAEEWARYQTVGKELWGGTLWSRELP